MHVFAWVGLLPAVLVASNAPSVVTEADVLSQLDNASPAVVLASGPVPLAESELSAARTYDNPRLEIVREDPDGATALTEWSLSWQLPGRARRAEIAAAEKSVDAATARVDHELRALRAALRADYARWAIAAQRQQLLLHETARLQTLASRQGARAEQGEASGLDAYRLDLAATALAARLALAEDAERQARADMERWLPSLPGAAQPELPGLPTPPPTGPGRQGGADHPLVTATRAELAAAELQRRASERYVMSPELSLGWQVQEGFGTEDSGPVVGLAWSIPLVDRNRAARGAAQARLDSARAQATLTARDLSARRASAEARYGELVQQVSRSKAVIESNSKMLEGAEKAFRYGELTLTDWFEVQRSLHDAQLAWLDLYAAALAAHRELETLVLAAPKLHVTEETEP